MDHHSSYVRSGNRGSNSGADERYMDLSLRLGLPYQNENENENHVNLIVPNSNRLPNFNFINPYATHQQLAGESRMINGGGQTSINAIGMMNMPTPNSINYGMGIGTAMANMNLNASSVSWPSQRIENHNNYYMNNVGSVVGVPIMPHVQYANNFNYDAQTINTASSGSSSSSSSSSSRRKESRRHHSGPHIDINRRCTNLSCNTNDTPMWRKGPLGPKTLCNACGIKYRKEAERKRAREAEKNSNA